MTEGIPHAPEAIMQFPEIAAEIDTMAKVDQDMRGKNLDDNSWDEGVDARNTVRMKEVVAEIGWPTVSKVGKQPSFHAWLLVQHADRDLAFQQECLALMKQEPVAEVDQRNTAMLEDRVRTHTGRLQLYGTQFRPVEGKHVPLPIEDPEHVDERRAAMGLDTLEENIAQMYANYRPPKAS